MVHRTVSVSDYHAHNRPTQLTELSRGELFSNSAYVFCDICDKSAVFYILQQTVAIFDIGNGYGGRN